MTASPSGSAVAAAPAAEDRKSGSAADGVAIGLDVGTSGLKAVAVASDGSVVATADASYPLLTPRPGWTEQRPEDWWDAACTALRDLTGALRGQKIVAVGLSGQMHGLVPLDASGRAVRPAILWNDQRTADAVVEIEEAVGRETLIRRGGNPAITGFQLSKLVWLRRHEPDAYARVETVLFPKDFIGYRLTGRAVAEPSDASGSNCFHLERKAWDEEVLGELGFPTSLFPDIVPSDAVVGPITSDAAEATGLPRGTPVVAGAGDNAAAATALGLSSARPSVGSVSIGTSGVIFAPLARAEPDPEGRVHLFCHADGGYHLLAVTLSAAGSMQWLRDTLFPERTFDDLVGWAEQAEPGTGGVRFLPYLAGERTPHMDPDLRGAWRGLSLASTRSDLVRAVLEGVAFSLRDALEVIGSLTDLDRALATGGGARSNTWLQLVCDVLDLPLRRPTDVPGAAYGASALAWRAHGQDVVSGTPGGDAFEPSSEHADVYQRAWEDFRTAR